jgi:FMN phosphatase YigB (HAD superfamily)/carbamoylphosphate synthase large subunit
VSLLQRPGTALVLGGGGFQGLPVLRGLQAIGWRAVVADSVPASLNRFEADSFCLMPEVRESAAFREELLRVIDQVGALAVFSTTMYDLPALAMLRPELEGMGIHAFASRLELVTLLSDKLAAMSAALEAGLPVLPLLNPDCHDFAYPLIGKPRHGWGGLGIQRVGSAADWQRSRCRLMSTEFIWQRELLDFVEWSVDFAIRADGRCSTPICRRRLRVTGGFAVVSEVLAESPVDDLARKGVAWLKSLGGCGLFNIQFIQQPDGVLWLTDINPRVGTSSVCAQAAGANLVEFLVTMKPTACAPRSGLVIRTLRERFLPCPKRRIEGVVIDLDETLISQKHWMRNKLDLALSACETKIAPDLLDRFRAAVLPLIDEGPWDRLIDIASTRAGLPSSFASMVIAEWRAAHPATVFVHPDARSFIRGLQERSVRVALLTDNPATSQRQKIERLPDDLRLDAIILTDDLLAPKPDPRGFLAAAAAIAVSPDRLLMVGDSPWRDGIGALMAGYANACIIRRPGSMTNPDPTLFEPEFREFGDRLGWIDSLYGADRMLDLSA